MFGKEAITRKDVSEKPPLRAELFSIDQLEHHAVQLATQHRISVEPGQERLIRLLLENAEVITKVTNMLHDAVREKHTVTPAGEWLLDNFYLIEEQIRLSKKHLPKGYSKGLPKLENGPHKGFPRVYDIAIEIISHSDGHVDIESLSSFIGAYQKVNDLTLGELWAIPIMLRLALIENLRRVAARIAIDRADSGLARHWAKLLIRKAEEKPQSLILTIADMARENPPMTSAFVAEFARRLQWKGQEMSLALNWIEQHLAESSTSISFLVQAENQKQAADQVSMSNSIGSLRFLSKTDWREFVETMSVVEQTLRADPSGMYPAMDFFTRDQYRHLVERIARQSNKPEKKIAELVVELAAKESDSTDTRKQHVGYYLFGTGKIRTEKEAGIRVSAAESAHRFVKRYAGQVYWGVALLLTLLFSGILVLKVHADGADLETELLFGVLVLFGTSHFTLSLVNWWATLWIKPSPLPRMDFSQGVPETARTLVVVPTLLSDHQRAESLLEELEVRFLANRGPNLLFGLLTDFNDAHSKDIPGDEALVEQVKNGIIHLNRKYGSLENELFYFFHRYRQWNARDKIWMGYERKRGKLAELNGLLRGKGREHFAVVLGDERLLTTVRYVITLDTDTQLPRETASKLAGLMAHPLHTPVYSEKKKRITEGYGIIQPRLAISLQGATRSLYTRMHENDSGIDPYTRVTSDVYQDLFGEGSFIGKGIYDVDAFEKTLNNRFPENRILSHDLLEGSYIRSGFASDVQLYEEYPSRFSLDIARRHRWIRGDWQIWSWAFPWVPSANGKLEKNPLNALARWKIFDNLRRSLVPLALLLLLLIGWTILSGPLFWTLCVIGFVQLPSLIMSGWNMLRKPPEIRLRQHLLICIRNTGHAIIQAVFTLICLPYEAFVNLGAISRTLWRLAISHKNLLEWTPSAFLPKKSESLPATFRTMWISPLLGLAGLVWLTAAYPLTLIAAAPLLISWIVSPALVWWISRPVPAYRYQLTSEQRLNLRELARKTWMFFEDMVGEEDNWLPPDNLQQYPVPVVAHRTSPTNIGIALLANLSAYDFGFIPASQLLERIQRTFSTLEKLERYSGHFYNWYDTQTLEPLRPRYISTVDSGNLSGHLLTLRQGLLALPQEKTVGWKLLKGLYDTYRILEQHLQPGIIPDGQWGERFRQMLAAPFDPVVFAKETEQMHEECSTFIVTNGLTGELQVWLGAFNRQLEQVLHELRLFVPWLFAGIPRTFVPLKEILENCTLAWLASPDETAKELVARFRKGTLSAAEQHWLSDIEKLLVEVSLRARERILLLEELARQCDEYAETEYGFLFDKAQRLLAIGYNVDDHRRDAGFYDLLASEARLAVFVAIARGKIPQESWFALGRRLTTAGNTPVLMSWSGSMFEYLMPFLVMPDYEHTLLNETSAGMVRKQIEYARQQGVPWGISESCYNVVDSGLIYQYRAFGVPGLGFKRGLGLDLVIAPYATVMALMVAPQTAYSNLERMKKRGYEGLYGFYEAVDYTPSRLPRGKAEALIQAFMAHHQGMSLLSLACLLLDQPMQKRFEADPQFQTALLLLQEQVPKTTGYYSASAEMEDITPVPPSAEMRIIPSADTPSPEVQLLSNGRYHLMLSNAGGGYARWRDLAVTRWQEDSTRDHYGMFCYIRDLQTDDYWSSAYQPVLKKPDRYAAIFSQGRVEYKRTDHKIETHTEIVISPEDDIEIRRVHLSNISGQRRRIAVTSYGEVVLAPAAADDAHPAFSNLFVQTEILPHLTTLICTRRPRSREEQPPWMFHMAKCSGTTTLSVSFETDRFAFTGRGRSPVNPLAITSGKPLSGSEGAVLDPVVAIQYVVEIDPDDTVIVDFVTGISETREETRHLIDKYQDRHLRDRAFELSWTHSQVVLRQINATEADAQLYGRLAGSVIYANPLRRAAAHTIAGNHKGQSGLWSYSISGDRPLVLLIISDPSNMSLVRQLIQAQAYWQSKGLVVDLFILNEDPSGYRQVLQEQIQGLIAAGSSISGGNTQGRIVVRSADLVLTEDRVLLQTVARAIISDTQGSLLEQLERKSVVKPAVPLLSVQKPSYTPHENTEAAIRGEALRFFNGHGGFSADGEEYIILCNIQNPTPLPWVNVIANRQFGTIVSEGGSTYTWFGNAHSFRLTPWHNDPVTDNSGEALYIRDEETGSFWSASSRPAPDEASYRCRHGFGYTTFEHTGQGISSETTLFVDPEWPVKFVVLRLRNRSGRPRHLSVTSYMDLVLGTLRSASAMHIVTEQDPSTGALLARNRYNAEFSEATVFFDTSEPEFSFTCDRSEFIGRNNTLTNPDAMTRERLSGRSGAGLDPCIALQVSFLLGDEEEREIVFRIGCAGRTQEAIRLIRQFRTGPSTGKLFSKTKSFWSDLVHSVQIATPDAALNMLANGWLLYQVLGSRLWGRSGYYQSGGAFGFRDQLQDVLALLYIRPDLVKEQLLLAASRQFTEGDVQHWWHPPSGRGVRTLCSDDYLWLPFVMARYVEVTGDSEILNEEIPFLEGRLLNNDEESYYDLPMISNRRASLYEHCRLAIRQGLRFGSHGLPLMGSGDWNDGMNRVGIHLKGESVWLAFFIYDVLKRFQPIAADRGDEEFAGLCARNRKVLKKNINEHAWDGQWYRRAYFDEGMPLGSEGNEECRIDSISQSWAVLSGAGDSARALQAMESADKHLVDREKGLIKLLDPPFDKSELDPGYIKGYVPGVRENGGQYSHAAIWMIMGWATLGETERVWELFSLVNPVNHGRTPEAIATYKAEPYIMAADVYGVQPHTGRGGWTWYTGSAGWMYQFILEYLLGLRKEGNTLSFHPCVPQHWNTFSITYRFGQTSYLIHFIRETTDGRKKILLDGVKQPGRTIILKDDNEAHTITVPF